MSWGAYRPWPRMGDLGSQPYTSSGGYDYPTLQALQGGGMPGPTPFTANGPGPMPYGAGGGWAPPPPVAAETASGGLGGLGNLGGGFSALRGAADTPLTGIGPNIGGKFGGAVNGIAGPMLYGFGNQLGSSLGRDANNPLGRTLSATLKGAGGGLTVGGPMLGIGAGLSSAAGQAGYEQAKAPHTFANDVGGGALTAALGPVGQAGKVLGSLSNLTGIDSIKPGGLEDKVMGFLGVGGGGGDQAAAASKSSDQPTSQDLSAKLAAATSSDALASTASRLGINGQYAQALVSDFQQKVAYGQIQREAGMTTTVPKTNDKGQVLDDKGKVVDNPAVDPTTGTPNYATTQRVLSEDDVRQSAYSDFLQALPAIVQQQAQDSSAAQQAASMQAAIAQYMPQVAAPGQAALHSIGTQLLGSIPGLSPGMQQAATNYATTGINAADTYNTALTNSLAFIPQQQAAATQQQQAQAYQSQLAQLQLQAQLRKDHPELYPKATASSSDPLASLLGG